MGTIKLKGLKFTAFHGVYAEEKEKGNKFLVDISIKTKTKEAEQSDDLKDTLDYEKVYSVIKSEMDKPSDLLENVASRIADSVGKLITKGKVKLTVYKKNPPIGGKCKYTSVSLNKKISDK